MLIIKTTAGTAQGAIWATFKARNKRGEMCEAVRYSLRYLDGRTLHVFEDGQELRAGIMRGEVKIYGRIMQGATVER